MLGGDLRLFYLVWLMAVEEEAFDANAPEPMPGIGPISATLEAFADFFGIDPEPVEAAAERAAPSLSGDAANAIIAALPDGDKNAMLSRLLDGDPHVAAELGVTVRSRMADIPQATPRTAGQLRERAAAIRLAREQAAAKKHAAEQKRLAAAAEKARKARYAAIEATVPSRIKVREYRERLSAQGLRPIQIWVPDIRSPTFRAEAHCQSAAVAASAHAREDQAFINAVTDWSDA